MCLGIPVQIVEFKKDGMAIAELSGIQREIGVQLVPEAKIGDWVILHAGFAIQILDEKEAEITLNSLKELLDAKNQSG